MWLNIFVKLLTCVLVEVLKYVYVTLCLNVACRSCKFLVLLSTIFMCAFGCTNQGNLSMLCFNKSPLSYRICSASTPYPSLMISAPYLLWGFSVSFPIQAPQVETKTTKYVPISVSIICTLRSLCHENNEATRLSLCGGLDAIAGNCVAIPFSVTCLLHAI
jgi:hypothetical protein